MARIKLTAGRIADFKCDASKPQSFLWDSEAPGLSVRVTRDRVDRDGKVREGAKSYIFQGRLAGEVIRVTIGDVRSWSIEQARSEARSMHMLLDQNIDPRQEKADKLAAIEVKRADTLRADLTVGDAWSAYITARTPKWGSRHLLNHQNLAKAGGEKRKRGRRPGESEITVSGPIYSLLSLRLADLDAKAAQKWLEPEAAHAPTQAAQAFRALRAFLCWCGTRDEYKGLVHADACDRRLGRDTLPKQKPKTDSLQREQLPGWFAEVGKIGNPVISAYLQTLLLIGSRREELATLRWEDIDFRWGSITIHDKVEGIRVIPLTPYVSSLLAGLKRLNDTPPNVRQIKRDAESGKPAWKPSPWVFPSPQAASGRLTEPRIQHVAACQAAGIQGLSLHGLRRSFKSLAEWCEMPVGIVAQIMGHKPSATAEKHYTVRPLDLLRMWHTRYEAWILEQAGIKFEQYRTAPVLVNSAV